MTARRLAVTALAVASAVAGFALVGGIEATDASWTQAKTVTATVGMATPAAPTNLRCVPASGSGPVPVRWDVPVTGPTPSGYRITLAPGFLVGSAGPYDTSTNSYNISSTTLLGGNWTMTVQAFYGDAYATGWKSAASNSRTLTTGIIVLGSYSYSCV